VNVPKTRQARLNLAAKHYRAFMQALAIPLNDETEETPMRVARMFYDEFASHNGLPPRVAKFKRQGYDQFVVSRKIHFASICEHHHLPFVGRMYVGYHPKDWLAGLSKISRVVRYFAARPQLQERLVVDVANYLYKELDPHVVMVVAVASHACVQCRGVQDIDSDTVTSRIVPEDFEFDKQEMLRLMGL
jgi:GTP cyclohydrolase I